VPGPVPPARAAGERPAAPGIGRHLLRWRRTPSPVTTGRVRGAVGGDALDRAMGANPIVRRHTATCTAAKATGQPVAPRPGGCAGSRREAPGRVLMTAGTRARHVRAACRQQRDGHRSYRARGRPPPGAGRRPLVVHGFEGRGLLRTRTLGGVPKGHRHAA